jgi:hypothetical protein
MKKNKSTSILNEMNGVPTVLANAVEGKDYINVSKHSKSELGKMLAYGHPVEINTVFGKVGTIRSAMDFITMPGYPVEFLSKKKLRQPEVAEINKLTKRTLPNYWAIVAYIVVERIKQDEKLQQLMIENEAQYTSFNMSKPQNFLGGAKLSMSVKNHKMSRYLSIIRHVEKMLKENTFTDENIQKFIEAAKDKPAKDIFDRLPFAMKTV